MVSSSDYSLPLWEGWGGVWWSGLVCCPLHTTLCSEGSGKSREDGDEDVEDFTPGGIVVESSHSVSWFCGLDIRLITQDVLF